MQTDATADLTDVNARPDPIADGMAPGAPVSGDYLKLDVPGCTLISVLGTGGMGVVFLARQERLQRCVAVKMLSSDAAHDTRYLQRLEREAQTLATLSHPNIVGCHDILATEQGTFLIMEYVPGQLSMRDLLSRFKQLPEPLVARIALDVAHGLSYAYDKGICHHDIKPDNLLVYRDKDSPPHSPVDVLATPHARVMICDFGIAREHRASRDDDATILGSPAYMAPEQAFDLENADFRADIYALGSTLYHLLTGQHPFTEASGMDTIERKKHSSLPKPRLKRGSVSDECVHVLSRMGAYAPDDRYGSYAEMLVDIEHWVRLHHGGSHGTLLGRYPPSFWRGLTVGLAAVVAVAICSFLGGALLRAFNPKPVSRAATLGYWAGERADWRVTASDAETEGPALTGAPGAAPLMLKQALYAGDRLRLSARLPGEGTLALRIVDETGTRWRFTWRRQGEGSSFSSTADGRDIPLVSIPERKPMQWLAMDIRPAEQQVDIHVEGRLRGVAPLKNPLERFVLVLQVGEGHAAQFTDIFVNERP